MNNRRAAVGWILLAIVGAVVAVWVFPHLMTFYPADWSLTRTQARETALKRFAELGEPVADPYVVVELDDSTLVERRLLMTANPSNLEALRSSLLGDRVLEWRVTVYKPGAQPHDWTYHAALSPSGKLNALRLGIPDDREAPDIEPEEARTRADAFLTRQGFDLVRFDEPEMRRFDREARTDLTFRYRDCENLLGASVLYGLEVTFAGDRLTGFGPWIDDPDRDELQKRLQPINLLVTALIVMPYLLFPFVAFFFLRRYHEGEIGVRRGVQVFAVVFLAGLLLVALTARPATEGSSFGVNRALTTWAWGFQLVILWFSSLALVAALSWSVGEARCRERWGAKLAAFDALFQRRWSNATVARSAFRGLAIGMALAALLMLALLAATRLGLFTGVGFIFGPWWENAAWPGFALVLLTLATGLYGELFSWLFLLPAAVKRFGKLGGGLAVAVLAGLVFWPPFFVDPVPASFLFGILKAAVLVIVFLRYDLLTTLLASMASAILLPALPFLFADHPFLILQGALPLLAVALPCLLTARYLGSDRKFHYRYEDVPPHVRRIAERERQRVELETARSIQASILPQLPPQLGGVELAHAYLPATEVGGDFYDVLDLEDGRLAVAVGDVAGHGVSSGLVMSMAKSTLALQVTVDPEVEEVMATLNRMVYRSARMRLLTTLCYALVDTGRLELTYGSAGHIAPYRIGRDGRVEALEAASYPLGVRVPMRIFPRTVRLEHGDRLFLFSDGVVEARREGTDELFGFDRLRATLESYAEESPAGIRDGVLRDLELFSGTGPRDDDQTILVLKVP